MVIAARPPSPSFDVVVKQLLPNLLHVLPQEWRGTTFNNSNLLGREVFAQRLGALLHAKSQPGADPIKSKDLLDLGNAEDYLRVASNVSTTLEHVLAVRHGYDVTRVFSFGSRIMPIVAVALTSGGATVHLYHGEAPAPLVAEQLETLSRFSAVVETHAGAPTGPDAHPDGVTLVLEDAAADGFAGMDGVVGDHVLYIANPERIRSEDILVIRKRLATPLTTPAAEAALQRLAGLEATADAERASADSVAEFRAHLQTMSGLAAANPADPTAVFTAGLPAIASLWVSLMAHGGANVLMASTAYGGSSQLTDLLHARSQLFDKSTFDVQGEADVNTAIEHGLDRLVARPADEQLPTTVIFVEVPTNPDQKVVDLAALVALASAHRQRTGRQTVLLLDTTFAPASQVLRPIREADPELPVVVFISLSKSVSRGVTTAGTLIANHTDLAKALVRGANEAGTLLDITAKPDQLLRLARNHVGVETRCQQAYETARAGGSALIAAVRAHTGVDMPLSYVAPEYAAKGFTSSTFSFNLPSPKGASDAVNAALAQHFVDLLTENPLFKPCVSFGQDNGLVYCTVPATSTQGAISEEHKAKQARGGVQLVRLSFPPTIDTTTMQDHIAASVKAIYA